MTTPSSAFPNGDPSSVPPPAGQFGSMPAAHPQTSHPAVPRPTAVDTAFLIYLISAGIGVLSNIVNVAMGYGTIGGLVLSIALGAVGVWVAMQMRAGQNWARIVLTVLGGIGLLIGLVALLAIGVLIAYVGAFGYVYLVLLLASMAASAATIVLMFRPESNRYFAS